jgi:uncharacterized protein
LLVHPAVTTPSVSEPRAIPRGMWTWSQHWRDVLFLHWGVPVSSVQPYLPPGVEADTWEGLAWVSLVIFHLRIRPSWLPFLPGLSSLTEVNFRTYVRCGGRRGICFRSIHADNRWAVGLARLLTPLPYALARLRYERIGDEFSFEGSSLTPLESRTSLRFQPAGECRALSADSLDEWLLERYRAFAGGKGQTLLEAEVAHPPWRVHNVQVLACDTRGGPWWGHSPARPPDLMHFAAGFQALFGPFRRVPQR